MVYLDNAATTRVRPKVADVMDAWTRSDYGFGNPSSPYEIGRYAHQAIYRARCHVANMINADPDEIFFTSCGSEANSWAIDGLYCIENGGAVLMSNIEHHSILNNRRKKKLIGVDNNGRIDLQALDDNIEADTPVVAIMMVNNEIGTIQDIATLDEMCFDHNVFLHMDAVQALGHIPIDVKKFSAISSISMSAHKIGGPKGVGALWIQKDVQQLYHSLIHGGQQEQGKRGGTENITGIIGFGEACHETYLNMPYEHAKYNDFKNLFVSGLSSKIDGIEFNRGVDDMFVPNIISTKIKGVKAEELIEYLNVEHVYVSSGSACNTSDNEPSHVLKSIGLSDEDANSTIRVSFGWDTEADDVKKGIDAIVRGVDILRSR